MTAYKNIYTVMILCKTVKNVICEQLYTFKSISLK